MIEGVVRVGDGRGFVVESYTRHVGRVIITAAHCLPQLPSAHGASFTEARTFALLGPLNGDPTIAVECLFADPVADIAVLGGPDNQVLCEAADAYEALVEAATPFPIRLQPLPDEGAPGVVLSISQQAWVACHVRPGRHDVWVTGPKIEGGMSGSPIVVDGRAVGVLGLGGSETRHGSPQACLLTQLPAWLVDAHRHPRRGRAGTPALPYAMPRVTERDAPSRTTAAKTLRTQKKLRP